MISKTKSIVSVSLVYLSFIGCNLIPFLSAEKEEDNSFLLAALALAGSGSAVVEETRPFRWRTLSVVGDARSLQMQDWNIDQTVSGNDIPSGIDNLWASPAGRFSYMKVNNQFEIIDSTLNLSPHGDHFHYDRQSNFSRVKRTSFQSSRLDTPTGTTPYSVRSKAGYSTFLYKGNTGQASVLRIVQEKRIGELVSNIPVWDGPSLANEIAGEAILVSGWTNFVGLIPSASSGDTPTQFQIHTSTVTRDAQKIITGISGWTLNTGLGTINCSGYNGLAATQIASPNAVFTDLENSYAKLHYVVISCGNELVVIKHNDDSGLTELSRVSSPSGNLGLVKPIFMNDNIERGSRDAKPLFIANAGLGNSSQIFVFNAEEKTFQTINTSEYPTHLVSSDTRSGSEIYILAANGDLVTYNTSNGNEIRRMPSRLTTPLGADTRLYGTWFATALVTQNETIHEFNVRENFKARTVSPGGKIHHFGLKGFFGPGSNYDGSPHN